MPSDAAGFLAALKANEDDEATRLIYADWLEEHGQYEEAERQRKWTKAKAWIVRLLEECREHYRELGEDMGPEEVDDLGDIDDVIAGGDSAGLPDQFEDYTFHPSFRELCDMAREAFRRLKQSESAGRGEPEVEIHCGNNMELMERLQNDVQIFWQNWSIVTGIAIPDGLAKRTDFSCAC